MLRCVRQLLVRPVGQTEEVRASYAAPSSPAAPGPELPVSLFVPANPQRAADQLQAYGQVTRMPPYASTSLAHSTPRPVAVGGNCYTSGQTLSKTSKTTFLLFFQKKRIYGIYILQMVRGKKLFVFANFAILPAQAPCRYWVYLGCEEWSRSL